MFKPKVPKPGSADSWGSLTTAQGSVASSWSVNQSTFVSEIHFSEIMKSNSGLTMNRIASYAIAAVIQVLTLFFSEDSPTSFCICMLIIIIGSESGDKSNVTSHWCPQKSRFTKRSPRSSRFEKRVCEAKSLGTSGLTYNTTIFSQLAIQHILVMVLVGYLSPLFSPG